MRASDCAHGDSGDFADDAGKETGMVVTNIPGARCGGKVFDCRGDVVGGRA